MHKKRLLVLFAISFMLLPAFPVLAQTPTPPDSAGPGGRPERQDCQSQSGRIRSRKT